MTDERLLADFVSHSDGSAFEAIVRRHGSMVFRVCRDFLGDRDLAEDAFQATFLVLVRQAGSIREQASLGRWLYAVACRISRRERRRQFRLRAHERQALEVEAAAPPDFDPADRELKPILHEEINRLPARLRDAIVLCYFEGLTVDAAARRLGCPVGTLKSRLGKGRELLRARLARRGLAASILLLLMFSLTEEASAALPDLTLVAGSRRLQAACVSHQVASMVLREEARARQVRMATWSVLVTLLVILGASRGALGRKVDAAPTAPLAAPSPLPPPEPAFVLPPRTAPAPVLMPEAHCEIR